jgi:hypothetical protein
MAVDLDITQMVDGNLGVHAMCPKNIFSTDSARSTYFYVLTIDYTRIVKNPLCFKYLRHIRFHE